VWLTALIPVPEAITRVLAGGGRDGHAAWVNTLAAQNRAGAAEDP